MVDETKDGEGNESLDIKGSSADEDLSKDKKLR